MRSSKAVAAIVVLGLFVPSAAAAETRFVSKTGVNNVSCADPGAPCAQVNYAVFVAAAGDTIQIGPGTYEESVTTAKPLTFVGAGGGVLGGAPAATRILGPPENEGPGHAAFVLPGGGTVESLRAEGGDGDSTLTFFGESGGDAIEFKSTGAGAVALNLVGVTLQGGDGGAGTEILGNMGLGLEVESGPGPVNLVANEIEVASGQGINARAVDVDGPAATATISNSRVAGGASADGVQIFDDGRLTLDSVNLDGQTGVFVIDGYATVRRSRIRTDHVGVFVDGYSEQTPEAEVVDSLVVSKTSEAIWVLSENEASSSAKVFGSTVIAEGTGGAVIVERDGDEAGPATATIRNSIVLSLPPKGVEQVDLLAQGGGTVDAASSNFTTRVETEGGTATAPGSAGNIAGPPGFIDLAAGVFALQSTSPLIDRGDAGIVSPGQLDLGGIARSLDGNGDCIAAPDIGAYEVGGQGVACRVDARPVVSAFGMTNRTFSPKGRAKGSALSTRASGRKGGKPKRGTKFTYRLSERALVTIAIERKKIRRKSGRAKNRFAKVGQLTNNRGEGRQSTLFSGLLKGRALRPGRYRATIVAKDGAGQSSEPKRMAFTVVH